MQEPTTTPVRPATVPTLIGPTEKFKIPLSFPKWASPSSSTDAPTTIYPVGVSVLLHTSLIICI